jgi:16S rRNA (cytidine1402-2'-O)-methyltransferase
MTGTDTRGALYLVATPIGNYGDITFRALDVLRSVDLVVYEERREGERLLKHYSIQKPVESLNEHNEAAAWHVILNVLSSGKSVALVSDAGTPVFADPGQFLVQKAIERGIRIVPIPGASSLLPALIVSGFSLDAFLFSGWLSPKKERRRAELRNVLQEKRTVVLMDTPYRLLPLLKDVAELAGASRRVCVAFNLTLPDEEIFRGTAADVHRQVSARQKKGEFVLVIQGRG